MRKAAPKIAEEKNSGERLNVRLPLNIREALEELQGKRFEEEGLDLSLNDLMVQAAILLLRHHDIAVERNKTPGPPRKPPKSVKTKAAATAVQS